MSSNPQWKSFQSPNSMNQDSTILDFKPMTVPSNGKSPQSYNYRSNSYSGDYGLLDKSPSNTFGNYGSSNSTSSRTSARFPIGTFSIESNNMFNSGDSLGSPSSNTGNSFTNGNSTTNNGSSYDSNSSANNMGTRETGIIEKLLHSYGFIQCCERQARLFFHFSQFSGNIEHLKIGDPVEFEMTYDRRTGKPIASTVTKIAPEVVLSEERVTGNVTTELRTDGSAGDTQGRISYENRGECFFLPYTKDDVEGNVTLRAGDKVSFQIATNNRGNLGACHIRLENPAHPVKYQGVVCSMKESFGFIERADVVKEIFFHFSEAKSMKEELRLGDDVEFIIQTRNGKEVACNITRLPPGTVIFEDVGTDIVKGQVLKPLDRGQNVRHQSDPLPGRIRYRAQDHSEVEIPFGDKDQKGDFTLRHGDWVQFKIATDRRDQLQRATNISLLEESFNVSGEKREQGVVASLKDGFGFLRCVDREPRLFFHFNEVLDVDREICIGDEFEFTVIQDQTSSFSNNRQSAIRMKRLQSGTVKFEILQESSVVGVVCKEAANNWTVRSPTKSNGCLQQQQQQQQMMLQQNGTTANGVDANANEAGLITYQINGTKKTVSFYLKDQRNTPRMGDKVEFNICQVKRTKELVAMDVQIVQPATRNNNGNGNNGNHSHNHATHQGFIAALKDGFGFIETIEHDREVFFHFSNFEGEPNNLELGQEVEYNLGSRGSSGSCSSAENVRMLPRGTIELPPVNDEILDGVVARPLRSVNPDQQEYSGLIRVCSTNSNLTTSSLLVNGSATCTGTVAAAAAAAATAATATGTGTSINTNNSTTTAGNNDDLTSISTLVTLIGNNESSSASTTNTIVTTVSCNSICSGNNISNASQLSLAATSIGGELDNNGPVLEYEFGIMGLSNKRELLQVGDPVQLQVDAAGRAANIHAVRKKRRATVDAYKGPFGFLTYEVEEGKKLFFHVSEVKDSAVLQVGDQVEFELVTNQRNGKSSACNVTKVSDTQARPERLISRLRTISLDDSGPKLTVIRQPRGPDGTRGFAPDARKRLLTATSLE